MSLNTHILAPQTPGCTVFYSDLSPIYLCQLYSELCKEDHPQVDCATSSPSCSQSADPRRGLLHRYTRPRGKSNCAGPLMPWLSSQGRQGKGTGCAQELTALYLSFPPTCALMVFTSCSFSGQIEASGGWGSLEYLWNPRGGVGRGRKRRCNFSDRPMPNPTENQPAAHGKGELTLQWKHAASWESLQWVSTSFQ